MVYPIFINDIQKIKEIENPEELKFVTEKYIFRANEYYLSLINWDDPDDPIKKIIIPQMEELISWGRLDPSDEKRYTKMQGLEHKYGPTALLLVSRSCGGICRFCFRKRIFMKERMEILTDLDAAINYISEHEEINNVLLTGGDPLMLKTEKLIKIIKKVLEIPHIDMVRIGTKMPAFYPFRITEDKELIDFISEYSDGEKRIYVITQFNHPRELTDYAVEAINLLLRAGAILANQTPILHGINDDVDTLTELFEKLSVAGSPPYYVFQNRPSSGNKIFAVPVEAAYTILEKTKERLSGLAKRARFIMSHSTGKIETVGLSEEFIFFRYHNAADPENYGKLLIFRRNPEAYWFDDYTQPVEEFVPDFSESVSYFE